MGAGSRELATDEQLRRALEQQGWRVALDVVPAVDERRPEIARVIELDRRLAHHVRAAVEQDAFPLVLAGNCNSCLGTVAGLKSNRLGVVWFDAHADFDTPDDNLSGFFDVMALSTLTGASWRALRESIPNFKAVQERDVVLAAVRDLEPYQQERLARSRVTTVPGAVPAEQLDMALDDLRRHVEQVYLHVDLDALDIAEGQANQYAAAGGPSLAGLLRAIDVVFAKFAVAGAALTAYDPTFDPDGRAKAAARTLVAHIAGVKKD